MFMATGSVHTPVPRFNYTTVASCVSLLNNKNLLLAQKAVVCIMYCRLSKSQTEGVG